MIKINLLPYRAEQKKEQLYQLIVIASAALFVVILIISVFWFMNRSQLNELANNITKTKTQIEQSKVQMQEIEDYKKRKEILTKKMDVITSLKTGKDGPVHLLDELSKAIPGNLWLTSVKQKGMSLEIEGRALDNISISNYMINLEKSAYINAVDLKSIVTEAKAAKSDSETALKKFIITCNTTNTPEKTG